MAPLASIPEVSHSNLDNRTNPSRQTRISSFERARRRSRVLIISRHPSRVRRRAISPNPTEELSHGLGTTRRESVTPSCRRNQATEVPATNRDDRFIPQRANTVVVSELDLPSQSTPARSNISIDVDSFPLPPSHNRNLPPSHPSVQNRATKQARVCSITSDSSSVKALAGRRAYDKRLPLETRLAHADPYDRSPSSLTMKGAATSGPQKHKQADTDFVDTITKSVAEQIGVKSYANLSKNRKKPESPSRNKYDNPSRSPSQVRALDTFTKELHRYAETVGAKGKAPSFTPTPSKSSATLRTVSALLPFRSEFNAAGLAVTSKDQKHQGIRASVKLRAASRVARAHHHDAINAKRLGVLQVDGKVDSPSEPTTAVEFTNPTNADIWRNALIDELPPKRNVLFPYKPRPRSRRHCLPCIPKRRIRLPNSKLSRRSKAQNAPGYVTRISRQLKPTYSSEATGILPQGPTSMASQKGQHKGTRGLGDDGDRPTVRVRKGDSLNAMLGLRKRHKNIAALSAKIGKNGQREKEPVRLFPLDFVAYESGMNGNHIDEVSQKPGKSGLPGTRTQQDHGHPNQSQQLMVDYDALSIPELPPVRRYQAGKAPPLHALRDFLADRLTAKALRQISRHDHGRYPVQLPPHLDVVFSSSKPPDIPCRVSSRRCQTSSSESSSDTTQVNDRDVLKGLHIAAAAACDKSFHLIVHKNTGVDVRRFLSELIAVDALGQLQPGDNKGQQGKQRRVQIRKLKQQVRTSRKRMQEDSDTI